MQDTRTGEMVPLTALGQDEFDAAIPNRARQGITLTVGEEVDIKGGRFCVHSIGRKMIVLRGLPGTKVDK